MLTKIKVYACYTVKIYKNKPQLFFKPGGGRPRRADPGSAFDRRGRPVYYNDKIYVAYLKMLMFFQPFL